MFILPPACLACTASSLAAERLSKSWAEKEPSEGTVQDLILAFDVKTKANDVLEDHSNIFTVIAQVQLGYSEE